MFGLAVGAGVALALAVSSAGGLGVRDVHPAHVTLVIMENRGYFEIIGNPQAPFENALARRGALMTRSFAVAHPSLPNYLALFSGDTWGTDSDKCPFTLPGPSLGGELLAAHKTLKTYAESIPSEGFTGCGSGDGLYARKHVPAMYFADVPPALTVSYLRIAEDASADRYPSFAFVVPNMCHDMHDCSIADGDRWLRESLPALLAFDDRHNGLLILTWDEDDLSAGNRIVTLLLGPMVKPGAYDQRIDHFSVLRTIEDLEGVRPLGSSAAAEPVGAIWRK